jgi:hypothetical protein
MTPLVRLLRGVYYFAVLRTDPSTALRTGLVRSKIGATSRSYQFGNYILIPDGLKPNPEIVHFLG